MVHFGSPFRLPVEDLFRVISLLSCGVDSSVEASDGGGCGGVSGSASGAGGSSNQGIKDSSAIDANHCCNGGIETLSLDVDLNMHDILDELFPPANKAWKNLRRIQIMSSWTDVEQLMAHLYKNG